MQEHLQPITDDLHNTLKDVQQTLGALQTIVKAKDKEILCLKREVNELQDKLDNYEQHSRRGAIRVFGVPDDFPGTTDDVLLDLCNNKLKLQPPISLDEIEVSHRVGQLERIAPRTSEDGEVSRQTVKPRPIIAKFVSRRTKARVMEVRKRLKNLNGRNTTADDPNADERHDEADDIPEPDTRYPSAVYISDDLTQKRAKLAFKARELRRHKRIKDTWVYDSQIMIKENNNKIAKVTTFDDLRKYNWNVEKSNMCILTTFWHKQVLQSLQLCTKISIWIHYYTDRLVREGRDSIALAMELRLSCINSSIFYWEKTRPHEDRFMHSMFMGLTIIVSFSLVFVICFVTRLHFFHVILFHFFMTSTSDNSLRTITNLSILFITLCIYLSSQSQDG